MMPSGSMNRLARSWVSWAGVCWLSRCCCCLPSGKRATIAGKPEPHLFAMAREALGGCESVAMVGDRLSSDIEGGRHAGLETILVLSGTTTRAEAEAARPAPDFVLENLSGLLA